MSNTGVAQAESNHESIYLQTPLGQSLEEAMEQMGLNQEQKLRIIEKFHNAHERQFDTLNDCPEGIDSGLGGPEQFGTSLSKNSIVRKSIKKPTKHFVKSECKYYNQSFTAWSMAMRDFKVQFENWDAITGEACIFIAVPSNDYKMKVTKK